MALWKTKATTAITTVTSSNALDVSQMKDLVAEVKGITTGTVQVKVSEDGTNWTQVGSNLTANGRPDAAIPRCRYIKLEATVATSISAVLTVSGEQVPVAAPYYGSST